jgi:hypothetical protein
MTSELEKKPALSLQDEVLSLDNKLKMIYIIKRRKGT